MDKDGVSFEAQGQAEGQRGKKSPAQHNDERGEGDQFSEKTGEPEKKDGQMDGQKAVSFACHVIPNPVVAFSRNPCIG